MPDNEVRKNMLYNIKIRNTRKYRAKRNVGIYLFIYKRARHKQKETGKWGRKFSSLLGKMFFLTGQKYLPGKGD